jgi:glycosyltransferase involved in cell wall biosynthesis
MNSNKNSRISSPVISVIIPFCGDKKDLLNCLKGLQNQEFNYPFEVIVMESGNDQEVKQLINSKPNVILISSNSLMYPGKARNLGVLNSKSNLLAFTDADCVSSPNWLIKIFSFLKDGNEIVIGPIINLYPFHPIASVDNLLQFPDFQKHRPSNNISHFPACNLGITKELFIKTGGFPEQVETGEDVKFSESAIRICKSKIIFNTQIVVYHSGRKNFTEFMKHNESLGFHRGYLNLKISSRHKKSKSNFFYSFFFGCKRLIYISLRTLQWNPVGILRIVFYFPFLILGLSAWMKGFRKGNQKFLAEGMPQWQPALTDFRKEEN